MTAATLAAAAVLSGCAAATKDSAKDFTGERKAVAQTVEDLQKAGSKSDEAKICDDLLATAVAKTFKDINGRPTTCAKALKPRLDDADTFEMTVKKVTITGNRAIAVVKSEAGKKDRTDTLDLIKEGSNWKLMSIG
jgi:hypothetical protein